MKASSLPIKLFSIFQLLVGLTLITLKIYNSLNLLDGSLRKFSDLFSLKFLASDFLVLGIMSLFAAFGLWFRKKWSWYLLVSFYVYSIIHVLEVFSWFGLYANNLVERDGLVHQFRGVYFFASLWIKYIIVESVILILLFSKPIMAIFQLNYSKVFRNLFFMLIGFSIFVVIHNLIFTTAHGKNWPLVYEEISEGQYDFTTGKFKNSYYPFVAITHKRIMDRESYLTERFQKYPGGPTLPPRPF